MTFQAKLRVGNVSWQNFELFINESYPIVYESYSFKLLCVILLIMMVVYTVAATLHTYYHNKNHHCH